MDCFVTRINILFKIQVNIYQVAKYFSPYSLCLNDFQKLM